jgi:hypothetical protein
MPEFLDDAMRPSGHAVRSPRRFQFHCLQVPGGRECCFGTSHSLDSNGAEEFLFRESRLRDEFTRPNTTTEPRNFHFLIPVLNMSFMEAVFHLERRK